MNIPVFPCVLCIHNEQVRVEPLQPGLHDILKARAEYVCFVQADPSLEFQQVARVIDSAKSAGADRVGLPTGVQSPSRQPEPRPTG